MPYKGTAPFVADLLAGQLQMGFTGAPVVMPLAKQGRLRALAVSSASDPRRFPNCRPSPNRAFPASRPTSGTASPGRPASIRRSPLRLNEEINKAVASADVKARLEKEGGAAVLAPPEALGTHIAAEIEQQYVTNQ